MLVEKIRKLLALTEERASLEKKIANLNTEIGLHEKDMNDLDTQLGNLRKEARESQKTVAMLELEIKVLSQNETDLKRKLLGLVRQKDVDAVRREILATQDSREQVETHLLEELVQLENWQKKIVAEEPAIAERSKEYELKVIILKNFIAEASKDLEPLLTEIETASAALPDNIKSQYKRVAIRLNKPIVQLRGNHCTSCYSFISAQQLLDLKKKQIGDCKNCGRILFVDDSVGN